jgi:FkbM family methyltransferase
MRIADTVSAKSILKEIVRRSVRAFGFEIRNVKRPFGQELLADIKHLLGSSGEPILVDVGANDGQTALELLRRFPKAAIHCFEPNVEAYAKLRASISGCQKVAINCLALGDIGGTRVFYNNSISDMSSFRQLGATAWGEVIGAQEVTISTLDSYAAVRSIPHVDLLKTDTQGFDLQVLKGARQLFEQRRITLVVSELNFVPLYEQMDSFLDIYEFLEAHGFKLVGFYNNCMRDGKFLGWCDGLFVNLDVQTERANSSD